MSGDLSGFSLYDLFRTEAESQTVILSEGILALEQSGSSPTAIEPLMRAAHSLKGAARIVGMNAAERLAHALEEVFVAAQKGVRVLDSSHVDVLLASVDLLGKFLGSPKVVSKHGYSNTERASKGRSTPSWQLSVDPGSRRTPSSSPSTPAVATPSTPPVPDTASPVTSSPPGEKNSTQSASPVEVKRCDLNPSGLYQQKRPPRSAKRRRPTAARHRPIAPFESRPRISTA